jgi:hypothetical protein
MNDKQVKKIRRECLFSFGDGPTVYDDKIVAHRRVNTNRLNPDGTFVVVEDKGKKVKEFYSFPCVTRKLAECPRRHYQQMKKGIHANLPIGN